MITENFIRPVEGKITSEFGNRVHPITGASHFHNGIDIAVPVGTPVRSPLSGKIVAIDNVNDSPGGIQLIVEHLVNGKFYKTGYAHLSKILKRIGDYVDQADVIALSGNTGTSSGPHLHFTLTDPSGKKIDPSKWFNKNLSPSRIKKFLVPGILIILLVISILIYFRYRKSQKQIAYA